MELATIRDDNKISADAASRRTPAQSRISGRIAAERSTTGSRFATALGALARNSRSEPRQFCAGRRRAQAISPQANPSARVASLPSGGSVRFARIRQYRIMKLYS
jgi:hypothetical protein